MPRKLIAYLALGASVLPLLTACGGGGSSGGGIAPIAPPPPAPTPPPPAPPPPPPSPASYPSFVAPGSSQQVTLEGGSFGSRYTSSASGSTPSVITVAARPADGTMAISFDPATGGYLVQDGARSQQFSASDAAPNMQFYGPAFRTLARGAGTKSSDYLSVYRHGEAEVALTYTTLAAWTRQTITDSADGRSTDTRADTVLGVGGFPTLASDMPRTGQGSYSGLLHAYYVNGPAVENVTGQSRLLVDFGAGSARADLILRGSSQESTMVLSGLGMISGSRFEGGLSGGAYNGGFAGGFFGPQAAEFGLSFSVTGGAGERVVGVGAGRR